MKALIFDLDGTLIHSAPDIQAAVNHMLAAEGQAPLDLATVTSFIGNGVAVLVARVRAHLSIPETEQERLRAVTLAYMEAHPATLTRPYPGVVAALDVLRAKGHPIGLCTNKPEAPARAILDQLDLTRFFDSIVGGDRLAVLKPDPAPLRLCMAELGAGTAIYIGDSEVDAATAKAADLPFILFTEGYRKTPAADLPHRALLSDFDALPGLIDGL